MIRRAYMFFYRARKVKDNLIIQTEIEYADTRKRGYLRQQYKNLYEDYLGDCQVTDRKKLEAFQCDVEISVDELNSMIRKYGIIETAGKIGMNKNIFKKLIEKYGLEREKKVRFDRKHGPQIFSSGLEKNTTQQRKNERWPCGIPQSRLKSCSMDRCYHHENCKAFERSGKMTRSRFYAERRLAW